MVQRKGSTRRRCRRACPRPSSGHSLGGQLRPEVPPHHPWTPQSKLPNLSLFLSLSNALVQTVFTITVYIPLLPKLLLLLIWVLNFIFRGVFIAFNCFTIHVEVLISVILGFVWCWNVLPVTLNYSTIQVCNS